MDFTNEHFSKSLSYPAYRKHIEAQLIKMGSDPENKLKDYAVSNLERVKYLEDNIVLNSNLISVLNKNKTQLIFVVLAEGWCGDAGQNLTILEKIENESNQKIELKLLLRDDNLEIMDQYLTNGGRSIPIVIGLDKNTLKEIFVWGPRPKEAQVLMEKLKTENASLEEKIKQLVQWYENDNTTSLQREFEDILCKL